MPEGQGAPDNGLGTPGPALIASVFHYTEYLLSDIRPRSALIRKPLRIETNLDT